MILKNMKINICRYWWMISLLLATSCYDNTTAFNNKDITDGKSRVVSLSISAAPLENGMPGSRGIPEDINEGTDIDYKVADCWLMEYDDYGNLIGTPHYFSTEELNKDNIPVAIILPPEGKEYKCVVVANTHSDNIDAAIGDVTTWDKLKKLGRKIKGQENLYNQDKDILMNSVMTITSATTELDCQLYRNIAKLTLKITNAENSGIKITDVNILNIPDLQYYADRVYEGESPIPSSSNAKFSSLKVDNNEINPGADQQIYELYLPRNCRGIISNDLINQKNSHAPTYSTCVEIIALEESSNAIMRYRFYPGENMINDFNIIPNKHYILPITINGKGDVLMDSRVEEFGSITLPESNCYIVNPIWETKLQEIYAVPTTRINKFWDSSDGKKDVDDYGNPKDNIIHSDTEWIAEVIWQDAAGKRLINFCDKDGNVSEGNTQYTGTGENPFYFKPTGNGYGNVLIGVRKANADKDNYLWSWHLWITDYNPDYNEPWEDGNYIYNVDGGTVHRYDGEYWDNNLKDKYIMDRNIGAMSTTYDTENNFNATLGLYYQFGRKDPVPYDYNNLYDINGNKRPTGIIVNTYKVDFYKLVHQPDCTLYPKSESVLSWYNLQWYKDMSNSDKSIFDPSPPGWKMPHHSIFEILQTTKLDYNEYGYNFYIGGNSENRVWYPNAGLFTGNGQLRYYKLEIVNWTNSGKVFNCYLKDVLIHNNIGKDWILPVRCIRE